MRDQVGLRLSDQMWKVQLNFAVQPTDSFTSINDENNYYKEIQVNSLPHDNSSILLGDPFILDACDISIANCSTPLQTQSYKILNSKEVTEAPAVANGSESPSVSVVGVDNSLEIANETLNLPSTSRDLPGTSSIESHDTCISNNPRF